MRFGAKSYFDKNGDEFILRNAELSDTADLIRYLRVTAEETPYLIREPEEVSLTEEQEQKFIQSTIDAERELMLIAVVDGRLAGNCSLMRIGTYQRFRHRCEVAIALYQEFCGRGIGRVMLQNVLEIARERKNTSKLNWKSLRITQMRLLCMKSWALISTELFRET